MFGILGPFPQVRDNMIYLFSTDMLRNLPIRYLQMIWNRYLRCFLSILLSFLSFVERSLFCEVFLAILCIFKSITAKRMYTSSKWMMHHWRFPRCVYQWSQRGNFFSIFLCNFFMIPRTETRTKRQMYIIGSGLSFIGFWIIIRTKRMKAIASINKCTHRFRSWNYKRFS